jgi:hypothetical protein
MKITQYINAEKAIISADGSGIRQRWLYGLRLLRDPQAMSPNGDGVSQSLRHGITEVLLDVAEKHGLKLSAREIRYRVQCARTYPTESQIGSAAADFRTWRDLCDAGFPTYEAEPEEPAADHRTQAERDHARARQLLLEVGPQGHLFPLDEFEPTEVTLRELVAYADEQDQITERFAARGRERRAYLKDLLQAVDYNVNTTWQDAHQAAYADQEPVPA